jgi:hypothetical protein
VGFPDLILHGTATLAKAVSALVEHYGAGNPARVKRVVAGALTGTVLMPSTITVRVLDQHSGDSDDAIAVGDNVVHFDVLNQQGQNAIRGGVLVFSPDKATPRL